MRRLRDGSVFLGFGWNLPMVFPFKSAVLPWRWRRVASCLVIPPADLKAGPVEAACRSDPKGVRGGGASSVFASSLSISPPSERRGILLSTA